MTVSELSKSVWVLEKGGILWLFWNHSQKGLTPVELPVSEPLCNLAVEVVHDQDEDEVERGPRDGDRQTLRVALSSQRGVGGVQGHPPSDV